MSNVFSKTIFAAPNAATNPVNKVVVTKEINFVADFGWEPAISATEEIDQLTSGHWSPGKDDFTEVAGGTPVLARTFGNLLGKIYSEQDGSIK